MKYNSSLKRLTALLMACLMVFGMIPANAIADGVSSTGFVVMRRAKVRTAGVAVTDLSQLLTSVTITKPNGEPLKDGEIVYPNTDYQVSMSFKEKDSIYYDESLPAHFTYKIPEGFEDVTVVNQPLSKNLVATRQEYENGQWVKKNIHGYGRHLFYSKWDTDY